MTVTQWGDLNQPQGFLFSKILNALPEAKLGIPAGTNAFLLEALQQRFKYPAAIALNTAVPQVQLSNQQTQKLPSSVRNQDSLSALFCPIIRSRPVKIQKI